ncbi:MAG TPA: efflux RND transporter permease subunit [Gemmataceae bacterium]|nr:efflux RND transporter permease subunit [Gemmataceae bacterium]
MVHALIRWALDNPLIVLLLVAGWTVAGIYAFINVNVEAYPDPAPAIVEVVAQYPGASAEEVERQVSVPLEVAFAGMPGLTMTRSKSLFGLSHIRNQFEYGRDFWQCRQEVINRLSSLSQPLPAGVIPQISPQNPIGEIYRYTLKSPKDRYGNDIYTGNDLKALQDWVLEREFRRVPHVMDVTSTGGTVKRYEIHPDPDRLKRYGVTLNQLQTALSNSNQNVGADLMTQGHIVLNVRSVGLYGGGLDPVEQVLGLKDPYEAAAKLREEENRRIHEIRKIVIASVNNRPVRIEHIVEGGPLSPGDALGMQGVVVGHQTRLGKVSLSKPTDESDGKRGGKEESTSRTWRDEDDKVQCIVLLRSGDQTIPAVNAVKAKVAELNDPEFGRMLPGVQIEPYYDRDELVHVTTETVQENLLLGMVLVTAVLLMFLSNIRSALIVAINIPFALLFAFAMLFFRGKSANLLSIGAVDFGIIVDSSVIMVENIYRHLSAGEYAELPLKERILRACHEVERPLFFSTAIMVCAFIPLFTMRGPEGQLFGPMADTYAFALGGALAMAVVLAPVLCLLLFRNFKPIHDNLLVRFLNSRYLIQLKLCLRHRWLTLLFMGSLIVLTGCLVPRLGQEFMPQLEEGNLWITATFPLNSSMERVAQDIEKARAIIASYGEVEVLVPAIGRPDDGTDPTGYYRVEIFAPLKPMKEWPREVDVEGWRRYAYGETRQRTKEELTVAMNQELRDSLPGVDWNFSQYIRDNVTEAIAGVKGDNAVKIFGPDLNRLEQLAAEVKNRLEQVPGIQEVGIFNIMGQSNLEFRVDLDKCAKWGVSAADVNNLIQCAVGGKAQTSMIEGEKQFDVTLRWPKAYRSSETSILDMQVDISNNQVVPVAGPGFTPSPTGSGVAPPSTVGSLVNTANPITNTPRLKLRELVSPVGANGAPDPKGSFERAGASTIYREQGKRLIAVKFNVRGRDLGSAVADAKEKTHDLFKTPYRAVWDGEFNEMEKAQKRLLFIIPVSLGLIFVLLYLAFHSLLDAVVVFSNVLALSMGGIWALLITGTSFSISAAVGFVSLFGVAIMDGLLMISSFNAFRAQGIPLEEAILRGAGNRVRPVMMTALTAILGLLPAALALRPAWDSSGALRWVEPIGTQTQRPLAIVVVGGMITTLFLTRYLMPVLYSFYGNRQPPAGAGGMAH